MIIGTILLLYGSPRDIILAYVGALYAVHPRKKDNDGNLVWEFGNLYTPANDSEANDSLSEDSDAAYVNTSSDVSSGLLSLFRLLFLALSV